MSFSLCRRHTVAVVGIHSRYSSSQSILQDWEPLFASLREQPLKENHPVFQGRRKEEPLSSAELQLLSDALNGTQSHSRFKGPSLTSQLRSSPAKNLAPIYSRQASHTQTQSPSFNNVTSKKPSINYQQNAANYYLETKLSQLSLLSTPSQTWAWAEETVFQAWDSYEKSLSSTSQHPHMQSFQPSVYSQLVANLMSTFRDRFKAPSMALAVFRRVSLQSPTSYVSACTTPVYNQLFATLWFVYGDVIAFANALNEMIAAGVKLDVRTQVIINSITSTYANALHNVHNSLSENNTQNDLTEETSEDEESLRAVYAEAEKLDIEIPENTLQQHGNQFTTSTSSTKNFKVDRKLCFSPAERAAIVQIDNIAAESRAYHDHVSIRYRDRRDNQDERDPPPVLFRPFDPAHPIDKTLL